MEHRKIHGGEHWLPFARSRIKALRALGSPYADQRFDMGDAQVTVRIEPGHEYIRIEGGGRSYYGCPKSKTHPDGVVSIADVAVPPQAAFKRPRKPKVVENIERDTFFTDWKNKSRLITYDTGCGNRYGIQASDTVLDRGGTKIATERDTYTTTKKISGAAINKDRGLIYTHCKTVHVTEVYNASNKLIATLTLPLTYYAVRPWCFNATGDRAVTIVKPKLPGPYAEEYHQRNILSIVVEMILTTIDDPEGETDENPDGKITTVSYVNIQYSPSPAFRSTTESNADPDGGPGFFTTTRSKSLRMMFAADYTDNKISVATYSYSYEYKGESLSIPSPADEALQKSSNSTSSYTGAVTVGSAHIPWQAGSVTGTYLAEFTHVNATSAAETNITTVGATSCIVGFDIRDSFLAVMKGGRTIYTRIIRDADAVDTITQQISDNSVTLEVSWRGKKHIATLTSKLDPKYMINTGPAMGDPFIDPSSSAEFGIVPVDIMLRSYASLTIGEGVFSYIYRPEISRFPFIYGMYTPPPDPYSFTPVNLAMGPNGITNLDVGAFSIGKEPNFFIDVVACLPNTKGLKL